MTVWSLSRASFTPVKEVDILRESNYLYRYMKVDNANTKALIGHSGGSDKAKLFSLVSSSPYSFEISQELNPDNIQTKTKIYDLNIGFYLTRFDVTLGTSAEIEYTSDSYTCPYNSAYSDVRSIFEPCSGSTNNAPTGIDFTPVFASTFSTNNLFITTPYLNSLSRFSLNSLQKD